MATPPPPPRPSLPYRYSHLPQLEFTPGQKATLRAGSGPRVPTVSEWQTTAARMTIADFIRARSKGRKAIKARGEAL